MDQPTFAFDDEPPVGEMPVDEMPADEIDVPTFSVGELNALVRDALRHTFPVEVWVRGEVQNLSRSGAGHTYFAVVEKAGRGDRVQARLDVVLFRDDRRAVDRALAEVPGSELGNDLEVRIRGRVTIYPPTGRYQLVMTGIDPVFTVGGIAANRERVLRALASEGLLDANGGRALAPVPLRIGLVTSAGSAAYHDFVHELERSGYAWQVVVVDVRVQGVAAARRIKWALGELSRLDVDAVVLAGRRIACRPRTVRHRVGSACDRGDACTCDHRRRPRDRPQRRRRRRTHRVQDADGVRADAVAARARVRRPARRRVAPGERAGPSTHGGGRTRARRRHQPRQA